MSIKTVNVDPVADEAFEKFLDEFIASNPAFAAPALTLQRDTFREILRTTFYLCWSGGEANALSKIDHE